MSDRVLLTDKLIEVEASSPDASVENTPLSAERAELAQRLVRLRAERARRLLVERRTESA